MITARIRAATGKGSDMHIIQRRGWEVTERQVTPEHVMLKRRSLLKGATAMTILPAGALSSRTAWADAPISQDVPVKHDFKPGRPVTEEKYATTYNNYYEFDESKDLWRAAQAMKTSPWTIEIAGMVKQPRKIAYEDLLKQVATEERIYRHRCVEAWAMTVPWTGFPMTELLRIAEPLGSAKYLAF
ncbi:MAG TPA: molybdopterin-dependent oxidoreductase, partial [Rhodopila sp.]|nr:molybdopterin-dependent oxidoreductase [Rhodopila sp.]